MNPREDAIHLSAQCWCDVNTGHIEMNPALAMAFAKRLEMKMQENDSLKQQVAENNRKEVIFQKELTYLRSVIEECVSEMKKEITTRDEALQVVLQAGKHLSDVLEHAVEMGQYTEGGSTEGWAKLSLKEWNAAFTKINTLLGRDNITKEAK